jgi:hypothetical protein
MRYTEAQRLRSEIGTVEGFLSALPEDAVLERMSWESRLTVLRERLTEVEAQPEAHPLTLVFRGAPVEGSRSIDATFASRAVKAFVEATDTVAASLLSDGLRDRGRLPGTGGRSLRIVDTTVGSFGFELELPPAAPAQQAALFPHDAPDPYVDAIVTTMKLLDQAARHDEDAISDLVAEIHPRAAAKVRGFAQVLAESGALFGAAFGDREVRFENNEEVGRVMTSLAESDISEDRETLGATLLGVLPESRRFEARLADRKVVQGTIDRAVADIDAFKARWENKEARLEFRVVRVRSRTRYVLTGASE